MHPSGRWQRSPQDPALDAALLLPPLRGAVPADDPRTTATLAGYLTDLTRDGYAYRFRHDDRPLADAEGSFTLCGFLVALALQQQHRPVEAARWYERTRACAGRPSCTPKSSTSTSTNSAATSRRPSCTPCTWKPPPA